MTQQQPSKYKELLVKIEELRKKMHRTAEVKGLADQEVLAASPMLDAVHEYYQVMKKKMKPPE